jgi:hypothetical protein
MNPTLPIHPVLESFALPAEYQTVWDDINSNQPSSADAVVVFAGVFDSVILDQSWPRWQEATEGFEKRLVAGIHTATGRHEMTALSVEHAAFAKWQVAADFTPHQSMWTIDWLQRFGAKSVALYAPQFHLTRATLTLIRWAERLDWNGKIIPYGWTPGEDPQDLAGFANRLTMAEMVALEQKKIVDHNKGGDVAAAESWMKFRP